MSNALHEKSKQETSEKIKNTILSKLKNSNYFKTRSKYNPNYENNENPKKLQNNKENIYKQSNLHKRNRSICFPEKTNFDSILSNIKEKKLSFANCEVLAKILLELS